MVRETAGFVEVPVAEFAATGLLWLANRALHPFGYAIAALAETEEFHARLSIVRASDPLGMSYSDQLEDAERAKFFRYLARVTRPWLG